MSDLTDIAAVPGVASMEYYKAIRKGFADDARDQLPELRPAAQEIVYQENGVPFMPMEQATGLMVRQLQVFKQLQGH